MSTAWSRASLTAADQIPDRVALRIASLIFFTA